MRYDTQSGRHSTYSLQYHLVFCTKYRKKVLTDNEVQVLKKQIDDIGEDRGIDILNKECGLDHVHILFRATPTTDLSKVVNAIKGATSRRLRHRFPDLKEHDSLWSPTYFLATTGEVTLEQLMEYVENQRNEID